MIVDLRSSDDRRVGARWFSVVHRACIVDSLAVSDHLSRVPISLFHPLVIPLFLAPLAVLTDTLFFT